MNSIYFLWILIFIVLNLADCVNLNGKVRNEQNPGSAVIPKSETILNDTLQLPSENTSPLPKAPSKRFVFRNKEDTFNYINSLLNQTGQMSYTGLVKLLRLKRDDINNNQTTTHSKKQHMYVGNSGKSTLYKKRQLGHLPVSSILPAFKPVYTVPFALPIDQLMQLKQTPQPPRPLQNDNYQPVQPSHASKQQPTKTKSPFRKGIVARNYFTDSRGFGAPVYRDKCGGKPCPKVPPYRKKYSSTHSFRLTKSTPPAYIRTTTRPYTKTKSIPPAYIRTTTRPYSETKSTLLDYIRTRTPPYTKTELTLPDDITITTSTTPLNFKVKNPFLQLSNQTKLPTNTTFTTPYVYNSNIYPSYEPTQVKPITSQLPATTETNCKTHHKDHSCGSANHAINVFLTYVIIMPKEYETSENEIQYGDEKYPDVKSDYQSYQSQPYNYYQWPKIENKPVGNLFSNNINRLPLYNSNQQNYGLYTADKSPIAAVKPIFYSNPKPQLAYPAQPSVYNNQMPVGMQTFPKINSNYGTTYQNHPFYTFPKPLQFLNQQNWPYPIQFTNQENQLYPIKPTNQQNLKYPIHYYQQKYPFPYGTHSQYAGPLPFYGNNPNLNNNFKPNSAKYPNPFNAPYTYKPHSNSYSFPLFDSKRPYKPSSETFYLQSNSNEAVTHSYSDKLPNSTEDELSYKQQKPSGYQQPSNHKVDYSKENPKPVDAHLPSKSEEKILGSPSKEPVYQKLLLDILDQLEENIQNIQSEENIQNIQSEENIQNIQSEPSTFGYKLPYPSVLHSQPVTQYPNDNTKNFYYYFTVYTSHEPKHHLGTAQYQMQYPQQIQYSQEYDNTYKPDDIKLDDTNWMILDDTTI
ncbi:hypothetical protein CHUAL_011277 [Chamberlinius hualienensis]